MWTTDHLFLSQKSLYESKFMGKIHMNKKSQALWRVLFLFFCSSEGKKKEEYISFSLVTSIFSTSQLSFIFNDWWYEDGFCHYTAWPPSGPELKKANISYITLENTSVFCCPLNYHQHTASEKMKKCPRLSATELGCLLQKLHFWRKASWTISFEMKPSVHWSLNDHLIICNVTIYYVSPCKQNCFISWYHL